LGGGGQGITCQNPLILNKKMGGKKKKTEKEKKENKRKM